MTNIENLCLLQRYKLQKILGEGATGKVYLAIDQQTNTSVALKQLIIDTAIDQDELVERFKQEYSFLANFCHNNLVRAFEFFELSPQDCTSEEESLFLSNSKHLFMVLEFIEGTLFKDLVCQKHNLPLVDQLALAIQIAEIVSLINQAGIIHRDIKPSNIMVSQQKIIKLLDLGISKSIQYDPEKVTQTGTQIGTPAYMSPEQVNGRIAANSDIFSLGVVLYQFFAAQKLSPFYTRSPMIAMFKVCTYEPPPLIHHVNHDNLKKEHRQAYHQLSQIITKTMAKDPRERIHSAEELARELNKIYTFLREIGTKSGPEKITIEISSQNMEFLQKFAAQHQQETSPNAEELSQYSTKNSSSISTAFPQLPSRYQILGLIGEGGMGQVYKVLDQKLNRIIALKCISNEQASLKSIQRFLVEAKATAQLSHPNIVRLYEIDEYQGVHFFTMDYIEGKPLWKWINAENVDIKWKANIVAQIADAVHYAHEQGIVHRDLKPENIVIDNQEKPYVMDFGIAKILAVDHHLTTAGLVVGTPLYMSPEQARGNKEQIKPHSDIYSLGVILYELLTGEVPFHGKDTFDLLKKIVQDPPPPLNNLNVKIPRQLNNICLKALAKQPDERYLTAAYMAQDLRNFDKRFYFQALPVPTAANKRRLFIAFIIFFIAIVFIWDQRQKYKQTENKSKKMLIIKQQPHKPDKPVENKVKQNDKTKTVQNDKNQQNKDIKITADEKNAKDARDNQQQTQNFRKEIFFLRQLREKVALRDYDELTQNTPVNLLERWHKSDLFVSKHLYSRVAGKVKKQRRKIERDIRMQLMKLQKQLKDNRQNIPSINQLANDLIDIKYDKIWQKIKMKNVPLEQQARHLKRLYNKRTKKN